VKRAIPYNITLYSAIKAGGKKEEGWEKCSELEHLYSKVTFTRDRALLSWKWLNCCLPMGLVNEFLTVLCLHMQLLLYLLNWLYLNP